MLRALRSELPAEDFVYVADSGHAPYGDRTRDFIETRAVALVRFLLTHEAKAIVVACNTATGAAVETLRASFHIPIVAIEPAIKPAAARTRSGIVGVLATAQTLSSPRFVKLVQTHAAGVQVLLQPCSGLVDEVERGNVDGPDTRALVDQYVRPLLTNGADTIVLGCTHYPFLRSLIEEAAGPSTAIIDPAVAVARELRRRLEAERLLRDGTGQGTEQFWSSGSLPDAERVIRQLWQEGVHINPLPAEPAA